MLSPQTFLEAIITSLRTTIAPAISEPFPKAQAYMAAVILEFVARQVEERTQSTEAKRQILDAGTAELLLHASQRDRVADRPDLDAIVIAIVDRDLADIRCKSE